MKKGKEFVFPENVNKDYGVWKGLTVKDISILVIVLLIGALLYLIPPKSFIFVCIKTLIIAIAVTVVMAFLIMKPIKSRKNISFKDIFNIRKKYDKSQKRYYIAPKKKRGDLLNAMEQQNKENK